MSALTQTQIPSTLFRVMLLPGEVYRVPTEAQQVRVRTGKAWVSFAGRDRVLVKGGELEVEAQPNDAALVSSIGHSLVVLEVVGETAMPTFPRNLLTETGL